ncbi:DNA (cytosine-5)-methyltransferase 3A-like, partial [Anneissia japonica]|uniref:DNA (cytosine-5)-methyltransferase 3A-like n=1 Tax=Anneissia japonica TaxID=1529436 RepID=UPI0014259DF1
VKIYELASLAPFQTHYQACSYKKFNLYQRAVFQVLQVCAARAKVEFPSKFSERPLSKEQSATEQQALNSALINWAMEGFQPSGVEGFAPSEEERQSPTVIQPAPIPTASGTPKNKSKDIGR